MIARITGRYLAEYARRPLNLALLLVVPVIFVTVAAGALADFAELISTWGGDRSFDAPTAGWAAAFLAGVAGFFHVTGSHAADRRLAAAGAGSTRVVGARLASGLLLSLGAAVAALGALWLRAGIDDLPRAGGGVLLFAVTYLAIGSGVGALVRSEVNGSLVIVFVWMVDVFLGPAMGGGDVPVVRAFPTHFATLVLLGESSGHSAPLGDAGLAIAWSVGALGVATLLLVRAVRPARTSATAGRHEGWLRTVTGLRYAAREYRRNTAMWVLLVVVPVFFITLSFQRTPDDPAPVELTEAGTTSVRILSMIDVHGALMVAIAVAFLAGLAGLFVTLASAEADRRLTLSGFRPREVLTARLGVIAIAVSVATAFSVLATARDFVPQQWGPFVAGALLVAATYGMAGVLVGSVFGRLGGLYVIFLVPFLDVGIAQNIMFDIAPPGWAVFMPAHGGVRLLVDGAFTATFDAGAALPLALAWLAGLTLVAAAVFHRLAAPHRA